MGYSRGDCPYLIEDVPEDDLAREKDVQMDRLKQEGDKPENILEKIIEVE